MRKTLLISIVVFLITFAIFYVLGIPEPLMRLLLEIPPYENWFWNQVQEELGHNIPLMLTEVLSGELSATPEEVGESIGHSIRFKTSLMLGCVTSVIAILICVMFKYYNTEQLRFQTEQENPLKDNQDECENP